MPDQPNQKLNEIIAAIVAAVDAAGPSRGLSGSAAGEVARQIDPDFSPRHYGAPTLRSLITQQAPLRQIGASGLDPIYGRSDWPDLVRTSRERDAADGWRTWLSPATHQALFIDRTSGAVRTDLRTSAPNPSEIELEPPPADFHRAIAAAFLETQALQDDERAKLRVALSESGSDWWPRWSAVIRHDLPSVAGVWAKHRREAFEKELDSKIRALIPAPTTAQAAYAAIITSQSHQRRDAQGAQTTQKREPVARPVAARAPRRFDSIGATTRVHPRSTRERLIELARAALGDMSENDLRRLWLPLGAVIDAVDDERSR